MNTTERDELATIIKPAAAHDFWPQEAAELALAAGYRKPRMIPDEHFISDRAGNYPVKFETGLIVESADGSIWRYDEGDCGWDSIGWGSASLRGPATVLWEPTE